MSILDKILSPIGGMIDRMPRRTVDTIKQMFYLSIVVGAILGMIYGIVKGKQSAVKTGIQIIRGSSDSFEVDRRMERGDDPAFSGVTEAEYLSERNTGGYSHRDAPANERLTPENREFVVEADRDVKIKEPFDGSVNPERLAEIPHMDNTKVESEVTRIERDAPVAESKTKVIQSQRVDPIVEKSTEKKNEPSRQTAPAGGDIRDIAPIKNREQIVE